MPDKQINQKYRFYKKWNSKLCRWRNRQKWFNELSKKYKKVCMVLNCIKHILILVSAVIARVSVSFFNLLVGIPADIASSTLRLNNCVITAGIKKYKSTIKWKRNMIKYCC